jgi:hypothetical protein
MNTPSRPLPARANLEHLKNERSSAPRACPARVSPKHNWQSRASTDSRAGESFAPVWRPSGMKANAWSKRYGQANSRRFAPYSTRIQSW